MTSQRSQALFVCETFIVDYQSKVSVIGIFTGLQSDTLPLKHSCWVYFHIRGIIGRHEVRLTVSEPDDPATETEIATHLIDSNDIWTLNHVFSKLEIEFKKYGKYLFAAYVDSVLESTLGIDVNSLSETKIED